MPAILYFENQLILPFWAHFLVPISLNEAEQWTDQDKQTRTWNEMKNSMRQKIRTFVPDTFVLRLFAYSKLLCL